MYVVSKVGSGVTGAINYAKSEGKNEDGTYKTLEPGATPRAQILGGFNLGFNVDSDARLDVARRLMEQNGRPDFQGEKDFNCAQDCLHVSLNWARGETPSREQKLEAARDYLTFQGMHDAMATVIEHNDHAVDKFGNPHRQHIHIIASRVRPVGPPTVYPDHDRGLRDRGWATEYEERMNRDEGWAIPQGSQWRHDQRAITRGQPDYDGMRENLFHNKSVVTKYGVDQALAFGGHYGRDADYHRDKFAEPLHGLANYPHAKTAHAYTTPEIHAQEGRIMGMAKRLHAQTGFEVPDHIIEEVAKRYHLDDEQKASVRHLTRDNGFAVQTGDAGTGKSHVTNKAVRDAYEAMGRDVVGGGFTNNVVLQMKQDGLLRANTLDYWKTRLGFEKPDAPEPIIKPGSVFIYEEAGQIKNEHFEALNREFEKRGVKAILSGDPKQMASVERGAMMDAHIRQFGTSRLTQVYRHPEKQAEWDEMAKGVEARGQSKKEEHWEKAIEGLRKRNEVHWFDTPAEAISGIADQWYRDRKERPEETQLILGTTNAEVEQLNKAAIAKLSEHGERGAETSVATSRGPRAYAIGDRIVLRENHPDPKEKRKGFCNGALGNLIGLDVEPDGRHRLTVDIDRPKGAQRRMFSFFAGMDKDAGEIDTDHGYAGTNYRGQGATIDNVYLLHNPIASSPTNYVAMTRDKKRVFLAAARDETGGYEGLVAQMASGGKKRAAHSYFLQQDEECNTIEPKRNTKQQEEKFMPIKYDRRTLQDQSRPGVKLFGYEFGESGSKARGAEGLYKAKDTEEWHKISETNHASTVEGLKNGTHEFKTIDGRLTLIEKTAQEEQASIPQGEQGKATPEETLRKFGYPEETIGNISAGTKRQTAKMLDAAYPDGPPNFREKDPEIKRDRILNAAVQDRQQQEPQQKRDIAARRAAVDGLYKDHRAEWHSWQDQAAQHYGDPPRSRLRKIIDDVMRRPTAQQIRDNVRDAKQAIESVLDRFDKRSAGFKLKDDVTNKWWGSTKQKDKTTQTEREPKNAIGLEIKDKTIATGHVRKGGEVEKGNLKDKTKATEPGLLPSTEKNSPWQGKADTVTNAIDRAFRPAQQEASDEGAATGLKPPASGLCL